MIEATEGTKATEVKDVTEMTEVIGVAEMTEVTEETGTEADQREALVGIGRREVEVAAAVLEVEIETIGAAARQTTEVRRSQ